jgi:hypothetical protein
MKNLTATLRLTLLFPGLAFGETIDDLVKRDGIHYKKFSEVPFTGKVTGKKQGSLKNGKHHGPWVGYWDNGQLCFKITYNNGKQEGPYVRYHKKGQLMSKVTFNNDKWDGPWFSYHLAGTIYQALTGTFKNGKKVK